MPITPEQARVELAKRELARRELAKEQQFQQPAQAQLPPAEQRMQGRQSAIADLVQNPPEISGGGYKHPLGTILRYLQGAGEYMQGVPASIGLDLQAGRPQDISTNLGKVLSGQRPAEYGDVYAGAGVPEPLAAGAGLYTDVMFTPGGAQGVVGAGRAIKNVATKGIGALRDLIQSSRVLDKAKGAKQALGTVRTTLGQAKEIAMQEVKDLPVDFDWSDIPQKALEVLRKPDSKVLFNSKGKIVNTMANTDRVKVLLQDMPSQKDFVEAGKLATGDIIRYAGKVRDAMVRTANKAGRPELAKSLKDYHEFMDNYSLINDHLVNKYGNAMANKLKYTFKIFSEPAVKEAWGNVSKLSPELKSVMKDMKARELLKNLLKITAGGYALKKGVGMMTGQ
jgi:hypothetical protein